MKQLRRFLQFKHKLPMGLDLACGTGLSSKALCEVAEKVFACDSSAFMIEQTIPNEAIIYFVSEGKNLDFPNESFDIITVASALHWMDTNSVFNEVSRVLKPKAWLLVYDHHIKLNQSNLNDWYETYFKQHFPAPPRNSINIISTTGFIPITAAPTAAPVKAISEIGVSRTRSGPNSASKPSDVLNGPSA